MEAVRIRLVGARPHAAARSKEGDYVIPHRTRVEPWIARDEPPPFAIINPAGTGRAILACDHASPRIPRRLGTLGLETEDRLRHIAWDIGAAEVARALSRSLDAPLILAGYSRLVVDCNRFLRVADAFASRSEDTEIPGNSGIDAVERDQRAATFYWPYHDALNRLIESRLRAGALPVVVCVHSFTPVYRGRSRPWHVGVNYRLDRRVADLALAGLRQDSSLMVGENEPYRVSLDEDYTAPVHAERRGLPYVLFEIRQDLIASEAGVEAWADRLGALLGAALGHPSLDGLGEPAPDVREPRYEDGDSR